MPNNMGFYDRLDLLMRERKTKPAHVADDLGMRRNKFTEWKTEGFRPNISDVITLARYFEVSTDWLLTGEEKETTIPHVDRILLKKYHELDEQNKKFLDNVLDMLWLQDNNRSPLPKMPIPSSSPNS